MYRKCSSDHKKVGKIYKYKITHPFALYMSEPSFTKPFAHKTHRQPMLHRVVVVRQHLKGARTDGLINATHDKNVFTVSY